MRRLLGLLTGLFVVTASGTTAAENRLPSIQQIVERGTLKVAIIEGKLPPMIQRDKNGKLTGFDIELSRDIAAALGVEAEFLPTGPKNEDVIRSVAAGQADIGLSYLSESVEAAKWVFFTQPYMIEAHTVFVNRVKAAELANDCPRFSDLRRLAKTPGSVGVLARSPFARLAESSDSGFNAKLFDDMESLASAAAEGDIVASLQGELSAKDYLARHPEVSISLMFCSVPRIEHRVSIAVRPDAPGLLRWLDVYLAQRGVIIDLDTLLFRADREVY